MLRADLLVELLAELLKERDAADAEAHGARGQLVDSIAFGADDEDQHAALIARITARARVTVANTALSYARSGGDLGRLDLHLQAAFLTGPVRDATPVEAARRAGYLKEIGKISRLAKTYC